MKFSKPLLCCLILTIITYSCFDDMDDNAISANEINDFVWKGMNAVYLYKDNIPDLANDRFSSTSEYADYLNSFSTPEELFESLIHQRQTVDRFSWIVDDYIALEQLFSGVSKRSGYEFDLYPIPGSATNVFGIVRLVLPNSNASDNNLTRGQVFTSIDGVTMTESNYRTLFSPDSYTMGFADYDDNGTPENLNDDIITPNGQNITLTKTVLSENPIFETAIIDVDGENLGYLMYNGFTSDYNSQLNTAFNNFKSSNVQHLVLDLRYNPGGSVLTASYLGSMITGQFNGEVFAKLVYNSDLQANNYDFEFESLIDNSEAINSLNLDKIYVLTTEDSASASEMVINSLSPYIEVIQIGDDTTGKSQASITVYDSSNLEREGANPNHTYAMQPLVANTLNKLNSSVPSNGLTPTITILENPANYGVLGNVNEPLLAAAIADIQGTGRFNFSALNKIKPKASSHNLIPYVNEMYIDQGILIDVQKNNIEQD
ncbi:S41 family peptidase [Pontimicrobium sp. SW4]|uniref:S41 family peptidase n=1 Tax=Pontimicrobium sp. SW4 TaxID=3153519 RepID=A0AAU7BV45_9FLAO